MVNLVVMVNQAVWVNQVVIVNQVDMTSHCNRTTQGCPPCIGQHHSTTTRRFMRKQHFKAVHMG